jgi:hypothetical protein
MEGIPQDLRHAAAIACGLDISCYEENAGGQKLNLSAGNHHAHELRYHS